MTNESLKDYFGLCPFCYKPLRSGEDITTSDEDRFHSACLHEDAGDPICPICDSQMKQNGGVVECTHCVDEQLIDGRALIVWLKTMIDDGWARLPAEKVFWALTEEVRSGRFNLKGNEDV